MFDSHIHGWIDAHDIKTDTGAPLDFGDHAFIWDVYEDFSPKQAIMKAAQVTMSTCSILRAFWLAKYKGLDIIYTLPSESDRNNFVGSKVNRIIDQNPIIQKWTRDKDSIEQKRVDDNFIHFKGTWTERAAIMIPSDLNIYDEVDSSKQDVVEQYSSRLQHSKYGWQWYFSHPSASGFGVDRYWNKSDQKHWLIKCKKEHEQYLDWPDSIDLERQCYQCKVCKMELTDDDRRKGRWAKKISKVNGEYSGYWIPLLICPWVSAKEILDYYKEKTEEYFYNKVLGKPYIGGGNKLIWEMFAQNLTSDLLKPPYSEPVIMGIDTGLKLDYVVGGLKGLFHHGEAKDYNELDEYMYKWQKMVAVIDAGGDLIGSRKFKERWQGRVYLLYFRGSDKKGEEIFTPGTGDEYYTIQADRERGIQWVVDHFRDKRIRVQGREVEWIPYWEDWNNLTRIRVEDPKTLQHKGYKWVRSGRDHKCFVAGTKIITNKGNKNIEDIEIGDLVLTRNGFQSVVWTTSSLEKVISLGGLEGTPNHPIYTDKGFKDLLAMVDCDKIMVCQPKLLFIKVLSFVDTLIQKVVLKGLTLFLMEEEKQKGWEDYMRRFIRITLEQSQRVMLFITKILTRSIIHQKTWKQYQQGNIPNYICGIGTLKRKIGKLIYGSLKVSGISQLEHWLITKRQKLERKCYLVMQRLIPLKLLYVWNVGKTQRQYQEMGGSIVVPNAKVNGTGKKVSTKRVYNFEVEQEHEYFANGLLVHNCMATVCWAAGMDKFGFGTTSDIVSPSSDTFTGIPVGPMIDSSGKARILTPAGTDLVTETIRRLDEKEDDWRDY